MLTLSIHRLLAGLSERAEGVGPMWVRCDVYRRYAPFRMGDLA